MSQGGEGKTTGRISPQRKEAGKGNEDKKTGRVCNRERKLFWSFLGFAITKTFI